MITLPSLYPHQEDIRDRTRAALARLQRVILCAPPGVGKTRIAKTILGASANREKLANQSGKTLFAVHRRGLVFNASNSFLESPELPHGVIMSGEETAYGHRIQVASIDTLLSWFIENDRYETNVTFDLIVWDEAHSHHTKFARFLQHHDAYREELGLHPAYVIGLTATPQAKGLADIYKDIILGPPTQWLIDNKFLSPFRYFRATQGKLGLLVRRGDEFTAESQAMAMDGLAGDLVRDWKRFAEGRPTVGFFPRRSHAQDAMELLAAEGLRVEYVDGDTPDDKRHKIFRQLNEHELDYLCNVQVVERGTDIPRIGCVQLCVAIGSLARYRQMIGRGSRCHPAKTDCCVARGTLILTERGEIPIQDVRVTDRVWDGVEFCCHDGACCNGTKEVIQWGGLILTPDHKVLTNDGWKEAETAKDNHWRPVSGGIGGTPIRTIDDSNPYDSSNRGSAGGRSRLLALWEKGLAQISQNIAAAASWMRALHAEIWSPLPGMGVEKSAASTAAVPVPAEYVLSSLWGAWNRVSFYFDIRRGLLDCGEFGTASKQVVDTRPNRQRWTLRTGQPAMGDDANASTQSRVCMEVAPEEEISIRKILRRPASQFEEARVESDTDCRPLVVEVWDIRNAGPRNRYCANGVIVANCILDHGGNVTRHGFFEDDPQWSLDITTKDVGEVGKRPTIECPQCQAIYRGGRCRQCGYEPTPKERRSQGLEFDGSELKEVTRQEKKPNTGKSAEELMVAALFRAGKTNKIWKQACGIFRRMNEEQGTNYRVPKHVTIAGQRYAMIGWNSDDGGRRVSSLYPVTVGGGHGGNYLIRETQATGSPY